MKTTKPYAMLLALACTAMPFVASAVSGTEYKQEKNRINDTYKQAKKSCKSLSGNANDICEQEAKAKYKVGLADLEADTKGTDKARYEAKITRVETAYEVAKERCDDSAGQVKSECLQAAKTEEQKAKADAEAEKKTGAAQTKEDKTVANADQDAAKARQKADRALASEKCERLNGDAKKACDADVRQRFGS